MVMVVHQDSLKKANITAKMDELNLHLEQADRQFHKDRRRKQVDSLQAVFSFHLISFTVGITGFRFKDKV